MTRRRSLNWQLQSRSNLTTLANSPGGTSRTARTGETLTHARGRPAQTSAQPKCAAGAGMRIRVHHVHDLPVVYDIDDDAVIRLGRHDELPTAFRFGKLACSAQQPVDLCAAVYRFRY